MANQYKFGRESERKIAQFLRRVGADVSVSPGSRGASDLKVTFKSGTKWNIQVKSSRTNSAPLVSHKDVGRLKQSSTKTNATAVIANLTPGGIEYISARNGRKLNPSKVKK